MSITNGYITSAEAQAYTGVNLAGSTSLLDDVVEASSRLIDEYCGRHFYQDIAATRYFDTDHAQQLILGPFNDLASVTSITEDRAGDGTYSTTYTAGQYQLGPVGAASKAPVAQPFTSVSLLDNVTFSVSVSTGRRGLVKIVGTWGWPAVPIEVKQACRIIVAEVMKLESAPLGIVGFADFGVTRVSKSMSPRAIQMLQPYKHGGNFGIA
jgi:hypothetical protein